jgi:16S rRNA (guanine(966)-N(2))-methyltransferase RsmD
MRVISGSARGKKLFSPKNEQVRPTSDRVKESVFNILSFDIRNSVFVDLFCGSGAIGIEALSRGSKRVYFFDQSKDSMQLVKKNLDHCGFADTDYLVKQTGWTDALAYLQGQGVKADYIYLDPPYAMDHQEELLEQIQRRKLLSEQGVVILEYDITRNPIPDPAPLACFDQRKYGHTGLLFFRNQVNV